MAKGAAVKPIRAGLSDAREKLLISASALMCEKDTINISIRDVAAHSGLNSSLINYYFGNKDRLLLEVAEHDILPVIDELNRQSRLELSAVERLRMLITTMIIGIHRYPYINRLLMAILRDFTPEQSRTISDDLVRPLYEVVRDVIIEGMASGEFRKVDPAFVYLIISGACAQIFSSGATHAYIFDIDVHGEAGRDRFIEEVLALILCGLENR